MDWLVATLKNPDALAVMAAVPPSFHNRLDADPLVMLKTDTFWSIVMAKLFAKTSSLAAGA
jgi:hypothetical protein